MPHTHTHTAICTRSPPWLRPVHTGMRFPGSSCSSPCPPPSTLLHSNFYRKAKGALWGRTGKGTIGKFRGRGVHIWALPMGHKHPQALTTQHWMQWTEENREAQRAVGLYALLHLWVSGDHYNLYSKKKKKACNLATEERDNLRCK